MTRSIIPALGKSAQQQIREQFASRGQIIATDRPSKYKNKPEMFRSSQGFELRAASRKEAKDYAMLDLGIKTGLVLRWVPQVSFLLPGGVRYRCDALVWHADGRVSVRDAKGHATQDFKNKQKQMRSTYGLEIEIVR